MTFEADRQTLLIAAMQQLTEGVIITDPAGEILYVNRAAEQIHGMAKLGVSPDDYAETYKLFREDGTPYPNEELALARAVRDGETVIDARWLIRRGDGTEVMAEGSATPVMSPDGSPLGAVLTIRDRTAAAADRRALESALEVQKMLLEEVNHRVANNLSLLVSLLNFQARRAGSAETRELLSQTQGRIRVMSAVHSALYQHDGPGKVALGEYVGDMLEKIVGAYATDRDVTITREGTAERMLSVREVIPIALVTNELATNSLKYAFGAVEAPRITFGLAEASGGRTRMTYRDNGPGLPEGFDMRQSTGLGMTILQTLGTQLDAEIALSNEDGARFDITF